MVVDDGLVGIEEGLIMLVESSCEVDIFGVHKEAFVEESYSSEGFYSE